MAKYTPINLPQFAIDEIDLMMRDTYCTTRTQVVLFLLREYKTKQDKRETRSASELNSGRPRGETFYKKSKKETEREAQEYACTVSMLGKIEGNNCVYDAYSVRADFIDAIGPQSMPLSMCTDPEVLAHIFYPSREAYDKAVASGIPMRDFTESQKRAEERQEEVEARERERIAKIEAAREAAK